ncbi:hypothetical protein [Caloramator sp. Dgby_cultured_2]
MEYLIKTEGSLLEVKYSLDSEGNEWIENDVLDISSKMIYIK